MYIYTIMKKNVLINNVYILRKRLKPEAQGELCFKVSYEIIDTGNPFAYVIEANNKRYIISKLHFYAEGNRICCINLHKLPEDSEILRKIKTEFLLWYSNYGIDEIYKSLNIPRQYFYSTLKQFPFLEKSNLVKKVDIPFEELLEAYKNNKLEELIVKYNTSLKYIYSLLLKKLIAKRKELKAQLRDFRFYLIKKGKSCYLYKPKYDETIRKTYPIYYGKCDSEVEFENQKKEEVRIRREIAKLSSLIEEVKRHEQKQSERFKGREKDSQAV